jgi:hypothetical protein
MDEHRTPESVVIEAEWMTGTAAAFRQGYRHRILLAVTYGVDASDEYGELVRGGLDPDLAYQSVVNSRQNRNQGGFRDISGHGPDDHGNTEAP